MQWFKKIFLFIPAIFIIHNDIIPLTPFDPCTVYDVIVVGLGTSGSTLANRLTEDPNIKVLVIEGGRDDVRLTDQLLPISLPGINYPNQANNIWHTLTREGPLATIGHNHRVGFVSWEHLGLMRDFEFPLADPRIGNRAIYQGKGSTWGGSSAHNAGIYHRGHEQVYNQWGALGPDFLPLWSFNALLPYFKKMETRAQHRAPNPIDGTAFAGAPYYQLAPIVPVGQVGNFDPAIHGLTGPVHLHYADFSDVYDQALKCAVNQFNADFPGTNWQIDFDLDNMTLHSTTQGLTVPDQTGYDQFGSDFPTINPYTDGLAVFPPMYNVVGLGGVPPRIQRESAATAYVYGEPETRPNLTIVSEALVTRILFDDQNRAIGVEFLEGWNIYSAGRNMNTLSAGLGGTPTDAIANAREAKRAGPSIARASKEVILAGGVYNTPQVLILSGIGAAAELQALGIPVRVNLPGVGKHLVDHQEIDLVWRINPPYIILADIGQGHNPKGGVDSLYYISDPSNPALTFPDWAVHMLPGVVLTGESGLGDILDAVNPITGVPGNARYDGPPEYMYATQDLYDTVSGKIYKRQIQDPPLDLFTHASALFEKRANVRSEGYVRVVSPDPTVHPLIVMNFWSDTQGPGGTSQDLQDMANAFKRFAHYIQRLGLDGCAADPTIPKFDGWVRPAPVEFLTAGTLLLDDESNFNEAAFKNFAFNRTWGHHSCGTTKMGPASDPMAVVDARLRVYGVERLRVVDCSVIPIIPTSNTMVPAWVIAEVASDLIKQDLPNETPITSLDPFLDALIANFN